MDRMAAPVRCGVAGVGYLGQHHARIYADLPGCELAGVYDIDEARAREIASRHGCPVCPSLESLGRACEAISVVVPTDRHAQVAQVLFEEGCHLLIEKPICRDVAEAQAILEAARNAGRIVQVGHIEHFNPVMNFLEKAVSEPRYLTADRLAPFQPRGTEVGVVLDLMIHDIGIVLQLTRSQVERIDAVGVPVLTPHEDIANARLVFANGAVANLNASRVSQKKLREIRVFQPHTYLSLDFMQQQGHLLRKAGSNLEREDIPIEKGEPLMLELAAFTRCVAEARQPRIDGHFGKAALEVALEVTRQLRDNEAAYRIDG